MPPDVELRIELQVTRPAPNPFHPDLLSGPRAVSVGAEGAIVGPERLPSESARDPSIRVLGIACSYDQEAARCPWDMVTSFVGWRDSEGSHWRIG